MIGKNWLKNKEENDFSPYEDIKLSENDLNQIKKVPVDVFDKLYLITEAEMWKKVLDWKISLVEAQWALKYAKHLKWYFKI